MTPARERKAKERKARKEAGLVRVEMWVHKEMAGPLRRYITAQVELHRLAKEWRTIPTPPVTATMIAEMEKNTPTKRQSDEPRRTTQAANMGGEGMKVTQRGLEPTSVIR